MPAMEQLSAAGTQYLVARLLANAKGGNAASSSYPNQDWYKTYACGTRGVSVTRSKTKEEDDC